MKSCIGSSYERVALMKYGAILTGVLKQKKGNGLSVKIMKSRKTCKPQHYDSLFIEGLSMAKNALTQTQHEVSVEVAGMPALAADRHHPHILFWELEARKLYEKPFECVAGDFALSCRTSKVKTAAKMSAFLIPVLKKLISFIKRCPFLYQIAILLGAKKILSRLKVRRRITEWW
jgi:hypothetical protein